MNNSVEALIAKLDELPEFVQDISNNSIEDNSENILDLNRSQMLVSGIDSEGDSLGEYSAFTVQKRKDKGLQTEFIDLRYTGEFQDSLILQQDKDAYFIGALDPKWQDEIQPRWPDALGLTEDSESKVTEILTNEIDIKVDRFLSTETPPKQTVYAA